MVRAIGPLLPRCALLLALAVGPVLARSARATEWPDLASTPTGSVDGSRDAALVIAIEDYTRLDDIAGAGDNADAWLTWLNRGRGLSWEQILILRDGDATARRIRDEVARAAAAVKPGGTLWFVFIGHGAPSTDGRDGLLVGANADRTVDGLYFESVAKKEVEGLLAATQGARAVAVVDACFSGQSSAGAPLVPGLQPLVPVALLDPASDKLTVLTATDSGEFAGALPGVSRPAFSYLVLGALRGWADVEEGIGNRDGMVSAEEVARYARSALKLTLRGRTQTPRRFGPDVSLVPVVERKGPELLAIARDPRMRWTDVDDALLDQMVADREEQVSIAARRQGEQQLVAEEAVRREEVGAEWRALLEQFGAPEAASEAGIQGVELKLAEWHADMVRVEPRDVVLGGSVTHKGRARALPEALRVDGAERRVDHEATREAAAKWLTDAKSARDASEAGRARGPGAAGTYASAIAAGLVREQADAKARAQAAESRAAEQQRTNREWEQRAEVAWGEIRPHLASRSGTVRAVVQQFVTDYESAPIPIRQVAIARKWLEQEGRSSLSERVLTCDAITRKPALLGWCDDGTVYAPAFVGSLAVATADGAVYAPLQLGGYARSEGFFGVAQLGGYARSERFIGAAQLGGYTRSERFFGAAQLGGYVSAERFVGGAQVGVVTRSGKDSLALVRLGVVNAEGSDVGTDPDQTSVSASVLQFGGINLQPHTGSALVGVGLVNVQRYFFGVHLALVNYGSAFEQRTSGVGVMTALANYQLDGQFNGLQVGGINYAGFDGRRWSSGDGVAGAQLGAWNVTGNVYGAQVGGLNVSRGDVDGAQVGLVNRADKDLNGAQLGLVNWAQEDADGVQVGLMNRADKNLDGAQLGLVNWAQEDVDGAQVGLVNRADKVRGVQVGVFNSAQDLCGVQLGLLNLSFKAAILLRVATDC